MEKYFRLQHTLIYQKKNNIEIKLLEAGMRQTDEKWGTFFLKEYYIIFEASWIWIWYIFAHLMLWSRKWVFEVYALNSNRNYNLSAESNS